MVIDFLVKHVKNLFAQNFNSELLRWAKTEYSRDWEYAYEMLKQGKLPQGDVKK